MQKGLLLLSLLVCSFLMDSKPLDIPNLIPSGDPDKGAGLVADCVVCHGVDGNSINTDWPSLAEQNTRYLYDQLKYFQSGERENALMTAVTPYLNTLTDKQLLDIASFYSSEASNIGQATNDEELLALGESLYRAGDLDRGIPACIACHSINGNGISQAGFPKVSGQQKGYLVSSLKDYRSKTRVAGNYASIMHAASANLSDTDIDAVANYIYGLYEK